MSTPRPYRVLGEEVARARRVTGLSQREAARMTGVSSGYYAQVERGLWRPDADILRRIAFVLLVIFDDLAALAGYCHPREPDVLPVRPGYRDVLARLQERFTPEQLARGEQALALLLTE